MATDADFADYVCEQARLPHALTVRKMFGEYAVYVHRKVVALLCDNQVYVRPTDAGRAVLGAVTEAHPFAGAKAHFLVTEIDDGDLLQRLLLATADAMPLPKPKKPKAAARGAVPTGTAKKAPARKAPARKAAAKKAAVTKTAAKRSR
ncbi:MAG: TfoX/Sxy family protein [Gemmatimonadaceae bacterium]|nr:TfoX/Sxy family protein [Gemmatimonadaceae bacterium]